MKKILIILLFAPLALNSKTQDFRLGLCINPMIQWFSEDVTEFDNDGIKFGIEGGLVFENYFTDNYALNTGIRIGNQGGKLFYNQPYEVKDTVLIGEVNYSLQYITIPLGLKLKTNQIGYFSYYAVIGFTPQINIIAKASSSDISEKINVEKEIGLFNLSYHIGGGMEYNIGGSTALTLGIVYNGGFIDILTKQGEKEKLSFLTLQVGVMF